MNFFELLPLLLGIVMGMMTVLWLASLLLGNASIVDIFWGPGFMLLVYTAAALTPGGYLPRKQLILFLVTLWGVRLAFRIFVRNIRKPEDFRYAAWRTEHGVSWWWKSYFQVFLLQGFLLWLISAPLVSAQTVGYPVLITPLDLAGVLLWGVGFCFEVIADWQLDRHKADPEQRRKILTHGLWRYTRHPNYFGEAALWWGFYLIAAAAGFWWTAFSPILMTILLTRVSGVSLLEKSMRTRRGYSAYMRTTSPFFPLPPRK